MKLGTVSRTLSPPEQALATSVFGATLPPWDRIRIDDGLGLEDRPYTLDGPVGLYTLHIGSTAYPNLTSRTVWSGFGRIDALFIHEMTHVWQYDKGYNVKLSSIWAQTGGSGYTGAPGKSWDDYNVEQQADIVENWYGLGMNPAAAEFAYIAKVVRRRGANSSKTLAELKSIP